MKFLKTSITVFLGFIFVFSIIACSKGKSPVEPVVDNVFENPAEIPISNDEEDSSRSMLAAYNCVIDPKAKTFTVEPANRSADYHFPLSETFPDVLQITGYGWTPNFWADIKLVHPFGGSGIDAFDPRVIAILPANPGVSMDYPIFNVHANNSVILYPDGYTKLFDSANPSIVGNTNPFVSYFKDEPNRVWSSTGITEESKRWQMDISGFGGPLRYLLVVDVLTNYPDPPQPVIDNALAPVDIQIEIGDGLTPYGGSAEVTATLVDWQGHPEIKCKVECPDLFSLIVELIYSGPGQNPDEYVFTSTISNDLGAPIGSYDVLLAAWDFNTGNHIFKESIARINIAFDPVDITPPGLIVSDDARDVYISEGYAYVACENAGLCIIDVTPPESAFILNSVTTQDSAMGVYVSDGYAYVADSTSGLQIIDIDPPESAYIISSVDTPGAAFGVYVTGGYAYVADWWDGLQIIDIALPESAYIVNSVDTSVAFDVYVTGGYAYVADKTSGLQIIDIDPPESAYIVTSAVTSIDANDVYVTGGYAYVGDWNLALRIVDIDPPESPSLVKSVYTPSHATGVYVTGGYAYVANFWEGELQIINVVSPENAYSFTSVDTPGMAFDVYVTDGYAYVADGISGLRIIDLW